MVPIYPAFTIVGKELNLFDVDAESFWDNDPDKLTAVWECLNNQYHAHAEYVGDNPQEVMLVFDTEEDELAFKLRFQL